MTKKIAVVLSGCGHQDGAEITEAVSALVAISEMGAEFQIFAPQMEFTVKDHVARQETSEKRNILTEAARIARGQVRDLKDLKAQDFDALVFPGGFGAALNLSSWAKEGSKCKLNPVVERVISDFYDSQKPIGAICIAPTLIAKVLGPQQITLTIGNDKETADEIRKTGALHEDCAVDDFVTDRENRIVTTPAYMYGEATPFQVFTGIRKAIRELVEMA